jgi:lipid-binding SYLF domain-containing protein
MIAMVLLVGGCASAPKAVSEQTELEMAAQQTLQTMLMKDPALGTLLDQAAGYIVFPAVKQGGFIVGGAGGKGVIFEQGRKTGFASLSQASIGAQIGGQEFAELVIVRDRVTLDRMRAGDFDVGGQASAVILKTGAATATGFGATGVAVVIDPKGGAMLNLSLTGQRIKGTG